MRDLECVAFLQWALPRLALRWPGFRKVRRGVCRRVGTRVAALGLEGLGAYRAYLERTGAEWAVLDELCHITISRFYRDRGVFQFLGDTVFPELAQRARARGASVLHAWSLGCASGEEPYTLALAWRLHVPPCAPGMTLRVLATDVDEHVLARARVGCYGWGSVKELPPEWRMRAFDVEDGAHMLRSEFRSDVEFRCEDIRTTWPAARFDLILCRNLAFTYFDEPLQRVTLTHLEERLVPGGALVIGKSETLPSSVSRLTPWASALRVYRLASSPAPSTISA